MEPSEVVRGINSISNLRKRRYESPAEGCERELQILLVWVAWDMQPSPERPRLESRWWVLWRRIF